MLVKYFGTLKIFVQNNSKFFTSEQVLKNTSGWVCSINAFSMVIANYLMIPSLSLYTSTAFDLHFSTLDFAASFLLVSLLCKCLARDSSINLGCDGLLGDVAWEKKTPTLFLSPSFVMYLKNEVRGLRSRFSINPLLDDHHSHLCARSSFRCAFLDSKFCYDLFG